jgi:hypothetical protein
MLYLFRVDGLLGVVFVFVSAEWEAVDFSASVEWEVVGLLLGKLASGLGLTGMGFSGSLL